jgi:hypothetical protein
VGDPCILALHAGDREEGPYVSGENDEYGELLKAAGRKLGSIQPVAFPYGVIEGLAA